jgi:hypothetical protein
LRFFTGGLLYDQFKDNQMAANYIFPGGGLDLIGFFMVKEHT